MPHNLSNWALYLKERESKNVLEWPNSFVVWQFKEQWLYAIDVWVAPELRKQKLATEMLNNLTNVALEAGYKKLLTSADLRDPGCSVSIQAILNYGFKPLYADGQFLYFEKILANKKDI